MQTLYVSLNKIEMRALRNKPPARGLTVSSFQSFFHLIELLTAPSASQWLRI